MQSKTPNYVVKDFEGVSVVRFTAANLTGTQEMERIRIDLEAMVDNGLRRLVLDFKLVKYISSAALGLMLAMSQKLKAVDGKMAISHPENIEELLKVSRTEKLFLTAPDPKAAARLIK